MPADVKRPADLIGQEVILVVFLLLLLVWFLNREFEVSTACTTTGTWRLTFIAPRFRA